ncbi:hypothetical protein [Streptomyces tubercidicus]|uniref:Uncharacterized protein n=1 Tax=Streptomyces tubercidicus TaxID=47759 RepID=A0A640UR97_9ACTN|nr:hypothetical protein [Streptomyces tubercidicus]WAU12537.1 hypothetical protein STRTU_002899 [Streptomyces tubercidicus]GFE37990.1 hypothetical protein Stube_26630 [Streptomyces tubercidicus]
MGAQGTPGWNGRAAVSPDDWIAVELEKAPELTPERIGNPADLFERVQMAEAA